VPALARGERAKALAFASLAACVKLTLGLPFVGLMLVRRDYRMAMALLGIWIAVKGAALARMGGVPVLAHYRKNMAQLERPDQLNNPDPRAAISLARLDWPYLFNAINPNLQRSNLLGAALLVVSLLWLAHEGARVGGIARDPSVLAVFLPPLSCLSLLGVYHHHYDTLLVMPAVFAYLAGPPGVRALPGARTFVAAFVIYGGLWPVQKVETLAERALGVMGALLIKPFGCVVLTVMLAASLVALHAFIGLRMRASTAERTGAGFMAAA
jgi:hypothetical protein